MTLEIKTWLHILSYLRHPPVGICKAIDQVINANHRLEIKKLAHHWRNGGRGIMLRLPVFEFISRGATNIERGKYTGLDYFRAMECMGLTTQCFRDVPMSTFVIPSDKKGAWYTEKRLVKHTTMVLLHDIFVKRTAENDGYREIFIEQCVQTTMRFYWIKIACEMRGPQRRADISDLAAFIKIIPKTTPIPEILDAMRAASQCLRMKFIAQAALDAVVYVVRGDCDAARTVLNDKHDAQSLVEFIELIAFADIVPGPYIELICRAITRKAAWMHLKSPEQTHARIADILVTIGDVESLEALVRAYHSVQWYGYLRKQRANVRRVIGKFMVAKRPRE